MRQSHLQLCSTLSCVIHAAKDIAIRSYATCGTERTRGLRRRALLFETDHFNLSLMEASGR